MVFLRNHYLEKLKRHKDSDFIKVVSGIRRVGKSTILNLFIDYLKKEGIDDAQIVKIDLDNIQFEHLCEYHALNDYILAKITDSSKKYYIFIDEVQNCLEFQKAIRSIFTQKLGDIYISGSNAYMLSGELSTHLSGRYVEMEVFPLSFQEYTEAFPNEELDVVFKNYLITGGFPTSAYHTPSFIQKTEQLQSVFDSIVMRDVMLRNSEFSAPKLQKIITFLASGIGSPISTKNIANTLSSSGDKTTMSEVEEYLRALCLCYFFQSANNFDIAGKQILRDSHKLYIIDIAMRNLLVKSSKEDYGHILENIVFLELRRRGFQALVGATSGFEIDFVAQKQADLMFIQVSADVSDEATLNRELRPLKAVSKPGKKILLTMDQCCEMHDDIEQVYLLDWLMDC